MRETIRGWAGKAGWLAGCLLAVGASAPAASLSLEWDMPTCNADGTPLTDLAGSKLYFGSASGHYTTALDLGNTTTATVNSLVEGQTYFFAMTAYNAASNESAYSAEFVWTGFDPPVVTSVVARFSPTLIRVCFSEPVKSVGAAYTLEGGPAIVGATLESDGRSVMLRTGSPMADGQSYTLHVDGIEDALGTAIDPTVTYAFRYESDVTSGLVACWRMDEGAGSLATDDRHLADGTLQNGAAWMAGRQGTAVAFDGTDDYIAAGRADPARSDMTLTAWILWLGPTGSDQTIAAKRDAGTDAGMRWSVGLTADGHVRFEGPTTGTTFAATVPAGQWVHLAVVKAGSLAALRVNGVLSGTGPMVFGSGSNALVTIGGRAAGGAAFNGAIDEVRIYSRSVPAEEVRRIAALTGGSADLDADGVADQWTISRFGSSPEAGAAGLDADGDGVSNAAEFIAGTDPLDAGSSPDLTIGLAAGSARVAFTARPATGAGYQGRSRYYALEQRNLSAGGAWQTVSGMSRVPAAGQTVYHAGQGGFAYRTRVSLE